MTTNSQPTLYLGVMISSTFLDLEKHRQALIKALNDHELMHVAMENVPAIADADVISSSLTMVRKSSAYILIIGQRYGQIPNSPTLNPNNLSITELEFLEAQRLRLPILLFIMGELHPLTKADFDLEPDSRTKLAAFKDSAVRWHENSDATRVYKTFNSLEDFALSAGAALARLNEYLRGQRSARTTGSEAHAKDIFRPRTLYANPPYLGSHAFIGRADHIRVIDEWALASDRHPAFFLEAIGGTGKSILAWSWLTDRSAGVRNDWAGRFWYSFYERGAQTRDFLLRALTYMHGELQYDWEQQTNSILASVFLSDLRARPWLFVLDGVERLLVDYNRFDAGYRSDETAGAQDLIAGRPPLSMIRDDDDKLFRELLTASPSKLLLTSRLLPRCMVNMAHQPLPGLLHQRLPGLNAEDAETLFRACDITGESSGIRTYLKENCDCHPLTIGILAGLINRFLPSRGNFDRWRSAASGGAALNLAKLDLVGRRNHILRFALDALPESSRDLLATLALLLNEFDYKVLVALRQIGPTYSGPTLAESVVDLESHGFLMFHRQSQLYDLHPVVRNVVIGSLAANQRDRAGERVIDYFSAAADKPLRDAQTLDDLMPALHVVQAFLTMEKFEQAWQAYSTGVYDALWLNLELQYKNLALLRAFFIDDWVSVHPKVSGEVRRFLFNYASITLSGAGFKDEALRCAMAFYLETCEVGSSRSTALSNLAHSLWDLNHIALAHRIWQVALKLAEAECDDESLFLAHTNLMSVEGKMGRIDAAEAHWRQLDPLGREWDVSCYRAGRAEYERLRYQFDHQEVDAEALSNAENIAGASRASRRTQRRLLRLRGMWHLKRREFDLAIESLEGAITMARKCGQRDAYAEAALVRAGLHRTSLTNAAEEAARLAAEPERADLILAQLWEDLGENEKALMHAYSACDEACADGAEWAIRRQLELGQEIIARLDGPTYQSKMTAPRTTWPASVDGFPLPDLFFHDLNNLISNLRETNKEKIIRHARTPIAERQRSRRDSSVVLYRAVSKDGQDFYAYFQCNEAQLFRMKSDFRTKTPCKDASDYGEIIYTGFGNEPDAEAEAFLEEYLKNGKDGDPVK